MSALCRCKILIYQQKKQAKGNYWPPHLNVLKSKSEIMKFLPTASQKLLLMHPLLPILCPNRISFFTTLNCKNCETCEQRSMYELGFLWDVTELTGFTHAIESTLEPFFGCWGACVKDRNAILNALGIVFKIDGRLRRKSDVQLHPILS